MTEVNVFTLSTTGGWEVPHLDPIILPTTGPLFFPGEAQSLVPCPWGGGGAGVPQDRTGIPSPARTAYSWTGYAADATPLAVSPQDCLVTEPFNVVKLGFSKCDFFEVDFFCTF